MASGWVKSLQCKSRAFEDVYHPNPRNLMSSSSCRKSAQSIKDVIETTTKPKPRKPNTKPAPSSYPKQNKTEPVSNLHVRPRHAVSSRPTRNPDPLLPALKELPHGHPSRNVVEIIFHTSWSPKAFTGRIEMIFKVQNGSKNVARFEEYRELVKARAGSGCLTDGSTREENARCVADGNEMMRFHCLGPTSADCGRDVPDACGGAWFFPRGKGAAICTFSGSGGAHESAGGGRGRRAMLVCRVIAGRISNQVGFGLESLFSDGRVGFDSVSGENGELLVFDPCALLPCFLIIYKL
ncbi:uncharacterized protein LOC110817558 [Carica papaya]|uniref:uncharacterized protein LOC110817558 n=1 Tax=Carica papaya TaxID=3649 RepID=UPI000B8C9B81|nr:uncharacterized protein LOC110817558 [Carica papaya]